MSQFAVFIAGLLLVAESQASDVADRSTLQGFLSKSDYDKFITPNLNRVKHGNELGASPFTVVDDKPVLQSSAQAQEKQAAQELLANNSYDPISLSVFGIGLVSFVTMLGLTLWRALQPATIPTNTVSASGGQVMEMKSQDSNVRVNSGRVGWGQLSPTNSQPQTLCYADAAEASAAEAPATEPAAAKEPTFKVYDVPSDKKKEDEEDKVVVDPQAEEKELTKTITGKPIMGVSGFFKDPARSDQHVLDLLHAQNVWGAIVSFSDDMVANKKRLVSRSARYSGLLGVLRFGELNSADVATSLEDNEVQAWLAFDVAPNEVGATLAAAVKAKTVERVVVASTGPVPDDQLKAVEGEDIDWSVVSFDVAALADDLPEGGPLAIDRDSQDLASAISRDDACRVVAEAFVLEPATKKRFVVSNGGEVSAAYLRSLREQGFSRRAELGKLIQGDMAAFEEAQKPKEEVVVEKTEEEKKAEAIDRAKEYEDLFAESRKKAAEQREQAITAKAREWLSAQWKAKQWSTAAGIDTEAYIEENWAEGIKEASAILGYTKKNAQGMNIDPDDDDSSSSSDDDDDDDKD